MHIWSDYGDEIVVDKGQKLTKWCPAGKVSQRLSMKERGAKVLKQKKKSKKKSVKDGKGDKKPSKGLYTRESEAQLMLQAMAFNEKVRQKNSQKVAKLFNTFFPMFRFKFIYKFLEFET